MKRRIAQPFASGLRQHQITVAWNLNTLQFLVVRVCCCIPTTANPPTVCVQCLCLHTVHYSGHNSQLNLLSPSGHAPASSKSMEKDGSTRIRLKFQLLTSESGTFRPIPRSRQWSFRQQALPVSLRLSFDLFEPCDTHRRL